MPETRTPSVARPAYIKVFRIQRQSGAWRKTSTKLLQWNGLGHSFGVSACWSVISEVSAMNTIGARKQIATPIRMLWSATATRSRRRRTAAGARRRTIGAGAATTLAHRIAPP